MSGHPRPGPLAGTLARLAGVARAMGVPALVALLALGPAAQASAAQDGAGEPTAGEPTAGEPETGAPRWETALYYTALQVAPSPDRAFWQTATVSVMRRIENGSVALQGIASRRADFRDQALAADVYHDLWEGAYGHARIQAAPGADVLPRTELRAEIFQAMAPLELGASYAYRGFEDTRVGTFGLGPGAYVGRWYLTQRSLFALLDGAWSPFFTGMARRYIGDDARTYMDVSFGGGEEVLEAEPAADGGLEVETDRALFAAARTALAIDDRWSALVGLSYSAYDRIADRWGFSAGLIARW